MFAKLFNLFRKKPEPIEEEVPPIPSPVKKTVSTTSCGCRHCGPRKERPQRSTRELKPQIKRPDVDDNLIINSIVMGAVANYPEEHKSSHSQDSSHNHSYDSHSHSSYDSGHSHSYDSGSHDSGSHDSGSSDCGGCD